MKSIPKHMKKLLFATLLTIASVAGFAAGKVEKKDDSKVTYSAKKQFEQEFEKAQNVKWTVTEDYQKARFTLEGKNLTAIYDLQGNYLGATEFVEFDTLPEGAKKQLGKHYKDYNFSEAILIVGRPSNSYQTDDVGSYWINLVKDDKQVYLTYSESTGLSLFKTVTASKSAKN